MDRGFVQWKLRRGRVRAGRASGLRPRAPARQAHPVHRDGQAGTPVKTVAGIDESSVSVHKFFYITSGSFLTIMAIAGSGRAALAFGHPLN